MNYISLVKWALDNGISEQRARVLAAQGRITGATQVGRNWVVPPTAGRKIGRLKKASKK